MTHNIKVSSTIFGNLWFFDEIVQNKMSYVELCFIADDCMSTNKVH